MRPRLKISRGVGLKKEIQMKTGRIWRLLICGVVWLPSVAMAQIRPTFLPPPVLAEPVPISDAEARRKIRPVSLRKIILVGDSTVQVASGWGGAFCADHVTTYVACVNMGRGGRSTLSYRAEGSWAYALAEAKTPGYAQVYVIIQFGHNDQPGKPGHSTDIDTEFSQNLRQYVRDAREAGAIPVLVTPLARRAFVEGALQDTLLPWADKIRAVAGEMDAPLIDLHASSVAWVQALGPVDSLELSQQKPSAEVIAAAKSGTSIGAFRPGVTETAVTQQALQSVKFDYTHLGAKGAAVFAHQVAEGLLTVAPDLRNQVKP